MASTQGFKRTIGLPAATALVVSSIIGSGIFMRPAEMAALLGSPILILVVWLVAGIFTLFSTMVLAELGGMFPDTGGNYSFMQKMYGDFWAYLFGWAAFAVINCAGTAGIAFITSQYAEYFFTLPRFSPQTEMSLVLHIPLAGEIYPLQNIGVKLLTILILCLFTCISYRSTKGSGRLQFLFSIIKVTAILFLIFGLFFSGRGNADNFFIRSESIAPAGFALITALVAACNGALQAFDGCNNLLNMAGEIRNPGKNIPRSLLLGILICMAVYLLTNAAMLYVLPVDRMAHSSLVASDAATVAFGAIGGGLIAFMICVSVAGTTSANVFSPPRITYAMAQNNQFFKAAGKMHPRFQTPGNALIIHLIMMIFMVLSGSFFILADMYIFIVWLFNLALMVGFFMLRKKMPDTHRPYKVWGYPWMPLLIILFNAFYLVITVVGDVQDYFSGKTKLINSVFGLLITAAGIPLYYYFKKKK